MSAGFLYVLVNPSMPGLVKVGKTTRDPKERVAELSGATGVPSAFMLVYSHPVNNCDAAESWVHAELERRGLRLQSNREFFTGEIHEVVALVVKSNEINSFSDSPASDEDREDDAEEDDLAGQLYDLAYGYLDGTNGVLKNARKAISLFDQAAALGKGYAAWMAGMILQYGVSDGVKQDLEGALERQRRAFSLGVTEAMSDIAYIFEQAGQQSESNKAWAEFFKIISEEHRAASEEGKKNIEGKYSTQAGKYIVRIAREGDKNDVPRVMYVPFCEAVIQRLKSDLIEATDTYFKKKLVDDIVVMTMFIGKNDDDRGEQLYDFAWEYFGGAYGIDEGHQLKALSLLDESAALGYAPAAYAAGDILEYGTDDGINPDLEGAVKRYRRAFSLGLVWPMTAIACLYEESGQRSESNKAWAEFFGAILEEHRAASEERKEHIAELYADRTLKYIVRIAKEGDKGDVPREIYAPFCEAALRSLKSDLSYEISRKIPDEDEIKRFTDEVAIVTSFIENIKDEDF